MFSIAKRNIRGLTAFQIKGIALIFMTLDHIAGIGPKMPVVAQYGELLRMIGRLAAPLFLFLLVQSIRHTRSKLKFLLRLYLAGLCVGLFVTIMNVCLGEVFAYFTPGNIIFTFFYVALYVILLERLISSWKEKNICALAVSACLIVAPFVLSSFYDTLYHAFIPLNGSIRARFFAIGLYDSFLPTFHTIDYGIGLVILGVLLYFAKTKNRQCLVFAVFCVICMLGAAVAPDGLYNMDFFRFFRTFFNADQCKMIFALPIMFLYNGELGRKCKWFFYGYYPLHREIIFLISCLVTT